MTAEYPDSPCAETLLARAPVDRRRTAADTFRTFVRPPFAPYLRACLEDAIAGAGELP